MPTPLIKKLVRQGKGSVSELENKWDRAKERAREQGEEKNWAYVTTIFKRMVGASTFASRVLASSTVVVALYGYGDKARALLKELEQEFESLEYASDVDSSGFKLPKSRLKVLEFDLKNGGWKKTINNAVYQQWERPGKGQLLVVHGPVLDVVLPNDAQITR